MESLFCLLVAFIFLLIAFWWLDKQRWARFVIGPVKKLSWALAKSALKLLGKLLRKVTSLFDPY